MAAKEIVLVVDVASIDDTSDMDRIVNDYLPWSKIFLMLSPNESGDYVCPAISFEPELIMQGLPSVTSIYIDSKCDRFNYISGYMAGRYPGSGMDIWFFSQAPLQQMECLEFNLDVKFQVTKEATRLVRTPESSDGEEEEDDDEEDIEEDTEAEETEEDVDTSNNGNALIMDGLLKFASTKQGGQLLNQVLSNMK
jgi:hypothetical protein